MKTESHQFVTTTLPNQNPLTTESKNDTFGRNIPIDPSRAQINWPSMSSEPKNPLFYFGRKATALSSQSVSAWPFHIGLGWGVIVLKTKSQLKQKLIKYSYLLTGNGL